MNEGEPKAKGRPQVRESKGGTKRRQVLRWVASAVAVIPFINRGDTFSQRSGGKKRRRGFSPTALSSASTRAPRFFTPTEFAIVDELAEMIIPSDEHSPGARAVGVAAYLDARLAELHPQQIPDHAREQQTWRDGLMSVNRLAQESHGKVFMQLSAAQRNSVLKRMAEQEPRPKKPQAETQSIVKAGEHPEQAQKAKSPDDNYREQSRKKPPSQAETASSHQDEGDFFVFLKERIGHVYYTSETGMLREMDYQGNRYLQQFVGYDVSGNYTEGPPSRDSKQPST